MSRWLLFILLLLAGSLHADPQADAFQQGKALAAGGNTAHGKVSGNSAALSVPSYNTAPKEAALFADGKQDLSGQGFGKQAGCVGADTSGFAGKECDAINFLGDGRPDYPLTRHDALFNLSDSITAANRDGLAGLGSGSNTGGCVTTVIKNPDLQTVEHCEEWLKTEDKRCTLGRVVKVDKDVNYQCDKTTASKTSHECHKKLSVTCTTPTDGCSATGVQLGNIASDMRWEVSSAAGDTLITVGTIGNDYWGWGVYDRNTDFTINKISDVSAFRLDHAWFDDWLWVKVNGVTVYVGPHGGDRLDTDVYVNNWSGEARPGSWLAAHGYSKTGDMYWDGWGNEWHKVDYLVCTSDSTCQPYELRTSWDKTLNIDIRPYVREGRNTLWMRTVVGGKGESAIRLVTRQYLPAGMHRHLDRRLRGVQPMKRLFTLLLLLTHLLAVQTTLAAQCKLLSSTCVDTGTKTINGIPVTRACWDYRNTYDCYDPKSLDYCQALVTQGCQETASTCVDKDFAGACVQYRKQYRCNDKLNPTPTGVVYLNDSYTITEDRIDASQCQDAKANQTCTLAEHRCTEPGATRTINGKAIYKDCWAWEDTYTCLGERLNSCADLQAQGCQYQSKHCVESIPSGACQVWDLAYRCTTPGGTTETEDCSQKGFCLNGQCFDSSHPPDADFAKSVVGMEAVREAGTYLTPELQIFKGLGERCEIKLSGLKNCCAAKGGAKNNQSILAAAGMSGGKAVLDYSFQKASGYMYDFMFSKGNDWMSSKAIEAWGSGAWNPSPSTSMSFYGLTVSYTSSAGFAFSFDPYSFALQVGIYLLMQLLSCEEQEAYLQMKRGADLCHYVGSYCSSKLLGYCLIRKESHCCFNSRLARIIQEQGRPQLGKSWGSAQNPSCGGFTPEEFQRLDFGAMDLSAFIHEVMQNAQVPNSSVVDALVKKQTGIIDDKVKGYFQQ